MPSKKRTVKYSENTDPVDGDRNVEVSEEQSVNNNNEDTTQQSNQQNTEEEETEDERYSPSSGR